MEVYGNEGGVIRVSVAKPKTVENNLNIIMETGNFYQLHQAISIQVNRKDYDNCLK